MNGLNVSGEKGLWLEFNDDGEKRLRDELNDDGFWVVSTYKS